MAGPKSSALTIAKAVDVLNRVRGNAAPAVARGQDRMGGAGVALEALSRRITGKGDALGGWVRNHYSLVFPVARNRPRGVPSLRTRLSRNVATCFANAWLARQRSHVPQRGGCSSPKYRLRNTLRHS